jgi:hypothetical protein
MVLTLVTALALAACSGAPQETQQAANTTPPPTEAQPAQQPPPQPAPEPAPQQPAPRKQPPAQPRPAASTPAPTTTTHQPPPPPEPKMVELPAGTVIEMELVDNLSSKLNKAGDTFMAKVIDSVEMGGQVLIPAESMVEGTVTQAVSAKQMTGQAILTLHFDKINLPSGDEVPISASLTEKGKKIGKRTAGIVGGSAAGGAVLGRILGKDTKSAVLGAAVGAVAGTGIAASQKGQELKLPAGTGMAIELEQATNVPMRNNS